MPVAARNAASSRSPLWWRRPPPKRISRSPTRISPRSGSSSRLMQRSSVDFPDPEGPIIAPPPPRSISSETPFSTSTRPNDFHKSAISIIAGITAQPRGSVGSGELPFDPLRRQGQRKQHDEIENRHHRIYFERTIGRRGDHLPLVQQIGDRDRRHQRRVLQLDDRLVHK